MKVRASLGFSNEYRRAIRFMIGKPGLANRTECLAHLVMMLDTDAMELCSEVDAHADGKRLRKERSK